MMSKTVPTHFHCKHFTIQSYISANGNFILPNTQANIFGVNLDFSLSLSLKNLNPNTYKPCKHYLQNKFRIPPVFTTPTATTLVQDFIILFELWQKPTIMSPYLQLCPLLYPSDYFQCNRDDPITPLFKTSNGFHFIESKVQISSYNL